MDKEDHVSSFLDCPRRKKRIYLKSVFYIQQVYFLYPTAIYNSLSSLHLLLHANTWSCFLHTFSVKEILFLLANTSSCLWYEIWPLSVYWSTSLKLNSVLIFLRIWELNLSYVEIYPELILAFMKTGFSSLFKVRGPEKDLHQKQFGSLIGWNTGGSHTLEVFILQPGVNHTELKVSKIFFKNSQRILFLNPQPYILHQGSSILYI